MSDDGNGYEYGYGFFPGGDPRDFTPDYEMCSAEEIEAWKRDCEAWNKGEGTPAPPPGFWTEFKDGTQMHVLAPRYGMGTYRVRWEDDGLIEDDDYVYPEAS